MKKDIKQKFSSFELTSNDSEMLIGGTNGHSTNTCEGSTEQTGFLEIHADPDSTQDGDWYDNCGSVAAPSGGE